MVEKGNCQVRANLAQISRHHPEVIVVNPHHRVLCGFLGRALRKLLVDLEEHLPVIIVEGGPFPEGVQGGPEGFLGEPLVENLDVVFA